MREYSTREVAEISRLPEAQIRRWARAGLLSPNKEGARWRFSFQDLAVLRTAGKLVEAGVSLARVTRTLRQLHDQLPSRPLSAVGLVVVGDRVIVRDRLASWVLESGQGVFGFEMRSEHGPAPAPSLPAAAERQPLDAETLYQTGIDLELLGKNEESEAAYAQALEQDPSHNDARINLGRLLHTSKRLAEAEALYRAALAHEPTSSLAAFNLGVVLEDRKQVGAAIAAYRRAIAIDDDNADAHFNLSRLLEQSGDRQAALRHLARFRRLTR